MLLRIDQNYSMAARTAEQQCLLYGQCGSSILLIPRLTRTFVLILILICFFVFSSFFLVLFLFDAVSHAAIPSHMN